MPPIPRRFSQLRIKQYDPFSLPHRPPSPSNRERINHRGFACHSRSFIKWKFNRILLRSGDSIATKFFAILDSPLPAFPSPPPSRTSNQSRPVVWFRRSSASFDRTTRYTQDLLPGRSRPRHFVTQWKRGKSGRTANGAFRRFGRLPAGQFLTIDFCLSKVTNDPGHDSLPLSARVLYFFQLTSASPLLPISESPGILGEDDSGVMKISIVFFSIYLYEPSSFRFDRLMIGSSRIFMDECFTGDSFRRVQSNWCKRGELKGARLGDWTRLI